MLIEGECEDRTSRRIWKVVISIWMEGGEDVSIEARVIRIVIVREMVNKGAAKKGRAHIRAHIKAHIRTHRAPKDVHNIMAHRISNFLKYILKI